MGDTRPRGDDARGGDPLHPRVSVLLPTRNRPESLAACLRSVLACEYPSFEVVVVDQGEAADGATLAGDPRVRHVPTRSVGKSRALNEGLRHARGEVLVFTDDDCTVPSSWIARHVEALAADQSAGAVFAALRAAPHDPAREFVPQFLPDRYERLEGKAALVNRGGAGANMCLRRSVLDLVGRFDEALGPGARFESCEEFDIFFRVLGQGSAVIRDPANEVVHHGARARAGGAARRLVDGYAYGEGAVLGKHTRCADPAGVYGLARIVLEQARQMRPQPGVEPLISPGAYVRFLTRGYFQGLVHPVDRHGRLFRTVPSCSSA